MIHTILVFKCKNIRQGHPNEWKTYFEFSSWVHNKIEKRNCWDRNGASRYTDFISMMNSALMQLQSHLLRPPTRQDPK